jgi:DNA polymerase III subunit epsilon
VNWPWFKRRSAHTPDVPLETARYVVLDTEFTSLNARTNRLLSVGAVAMDGGRIRLADQFYRVANPGVELPTPGLLIHGLRPHDVAAGEPPAQVVAELEEFSAGAAIVGHFISIDLKILRKERAGSMRNPAIDTAKVHAWLLKRGPLTDEAVRKLERLDLDAVAREYLLDPQDAHHALGDAYLTAQVWQRMLPRLKHHNVVSLHDLTRAIG